MPAPQTLIFIDCENVPKIDLAPIAGSAAHVTLLLGKNQTKLDVKLVEQIKRLHAQVELVILEHSGRNALDLTLAYYLGRAAERAIDSTFVIVSKDKDYTALLAHLTSQGINAARQDSLTEVPGLLSAARQIATTATATPSLAVLKKTAHKPAATTKTAPPSKADRSTRILSRLRNPQNRNRPSKLPALRAHLKTAFGKEASDAAVDALVKRAAEEGVLTLGNGGAIIYLP